jgi:ABC-type molybdate transport system substrate-binding protein
MARVVLLAQDKADLRNDPMQQLKPRTGPRRRHHRRPRHLCAGLVPVLLLLPAWTSPAPDLVVYCTPTLADALTQAGRRYTAARHIPVRIFAAAPAGIEGLIAHMARADIAVADSPTLDVLAAAQLIAPTRLDLGADPYVLAAPAAATPGPLPHLLVSQTIVVTDPTSAASFDGQALLAGLSPHPTHSIGAADTPEIVYAVEHTPNRLGLLPLTSVRATNLLTVAAALPFAPMPIQAAATTHGQSPSTAGFLAFLQSPAAQSVLREAGLELPK